MSLRRLRKEFLQHLYESHEEKKERKSNGAVLVANYSSDETQTEKTSISSRLRQSVSPQLVQEAEEIVENAQYLAEQMKVARSYEIAGWNGDDYRNAHQWAVWVQENVGGFSDPQYLKRMLKERGLPMNRLLNAERAFLDSVLGFEGFNADILSHLIESAMSKLDEADERLSCLRDALADAVDRKIFLKSLDDILTKLGGEKKNIAIEAKAEALLRIHERTENLDNLDLTEQGVAELICWETLFALKQTSKMRHRLLKLVNECVGRGRYGDIDVMNELCDLDVSVFDSYLSNLLEGLHRLWRQTRQQGTDEKEKTEGTQKELAIVELRKRIQSLVNKKGVVGTISESASLKFCLKTGMPPFFRR
ncbi:unnamed protein product [Agarophyton chilense]